MKTATVAKRNSTCASSLRRAFVLIALFFVCFGLSPALQAVSPAPDGAYSGANTAEGGSGTLFRLTTGTNNTALGSEALFSVTTGSQNTATGAQALKNNTVNGNTADGFQALVRNTTGTENAAVGWRALFTNTTGFDNTATGWGALFMNTTGFSNTAHGAGALYLNTGSSNTAIGSGALGSNTSGESNTATGSGALSVNTTGSGNTANGANALPGSPFSFGGGSNNTAVGVSTIVCEKGDLENNTAVGAYALVLDIGGGRNNIAIGYRAGVNLAGPGPANNNIEIGNPGAADISSPDQNTIRIGDVQTRAFIAGIYGTTTGTPTTLPVIVDSNGQLGTAVSSERFKKDIKPMEGASQSILALKPVSFHYKSDTTNTPQFGLVAEQVEKVNPDLVVPDKEGRPYSVRYDQVNAMLLNEFLKEHRKVNELESTVARLTTRLEEQDSKIAKISDLLEMSRSSSRVAASQ
jgi:hypothetical protein